MSQPFLTLLLDLEDAPPGAVERTVASLEGQPGLEVLRSDTGGPVELLTAAAGTYVAVVSAGAELAPDAVAALQAAAGPETDLLYADEVFVDEAGHEVERVPKPLWSPERLLGQNWLGRPTLVRTGLAVEACAEEPLGAAWEHDLALRVSVHVRGVERVPTPLLSGPRRDPDPAEATAAVVRAHLARTGVAAVVTPGEVPGTCRNRRALPEDLSVAIVLACQGARGLAWGERRWFVVEAARSMLRHAGHANLEVVVVHHGTLEESVRDALLALDERVRLVTVPGVADRAEMLNRGVLTTHAEVVVLVDEHTEVVGDGFLIDLLGPLSDPGVGLVAPRVLTSNGNLVHAGLAFHQHRVQPVHEGVPSSDPGPGGVLTVAHECSGLGGRCLALRRETFDLVGGLREDLHVLDDVDLSWKVRHAGLRRVWVPTATMFDLVDRHKVSAVHRKERQAIRARWLAPVLDEYSPTHGEWHAARDERLAGAG